jgi:hypothetical protein
MDTFLVAAQTSLSDVIAEALEVDASRFRRHLATDPQLMAQIDRTITAISALLQGEPVPLESVLDLEGDSEGEPAATGDDDRFLDAATDTKASDSKTGATGDEEPEPEGA